MTKATGNPNGRPSRSRQKIIPPEVLEAVALLRDAMVTGERLTITDLSVRVGMSRRALSGWLSESRVRDMLSRHANEAITGAMVARAAQTMHGLLDSSSDYVKYQASERVLAINGLKPKPDQQAASGGGITFNVILQHGNVAIVQPPGNAAVQVGGGAPAALPGPGPGTIDLVPAPAADGTGG